MSKILEILDKMEFFQGQRAGRELWASKPEKIQNEDIESFNRDIQKIRDYILKSQKTLDRIVERLEEEMHPEIECFDFEEDFIYAEKRHNKYIGIVKEEGGLNEEM